MKYTYTGKIRGKKYCVVGKDPLRKYLSRLLNNIISRCYDINSTAYERYGGRGITICDEWLNEGGFENFYKWAINNGFKLEKSSNGRNKWSIDRIDNNKGYSPENCRWATSKEQSLNKTKTIWVDYNGEHKQLLLLCEELGLDYNAVFLRIYRRHWSVDRALSTPIQKNYQIEYDGQILEFNTIARMNDIKPVSLKYQWIKNNYDIYKAIEHFKGEECKKNLSKA